MSAIIEMDEKTFQHRDTESTEVTEKILGAAIEVHRILGPGLLESIYHYALLEELRIRGVSAISEAEVPVFYKSVKVSTPLRLDLLVESLVIVEIKAVDKILPIHHAQLLSYLRLTELRSGLLLNFNESTLKTGIHRVTNFSANPNAFLRF